MHDRPIRRLRHSRTWLPPSLLCSLLTFGAQAATITVNTSDNTPGGPDCSLREAISSALWDDSSMMGNGACTPGSGPDTIVFDPAAFPAGSLTTIALTDDPIYLSFFATDITIDGDQRVALDAGSSTSRVVYATGSDIRLTLRGLTLRNGRTNSSSDGGNNGAGIYLDNGVTLRLENSVVEDNVAGIGGGGIFSSDSTLTIVDSVFTGNVATYGWGGAVYSTGSGSLTVERSRFEQNTANTQGGALYSGVPTTITDSTITRNSLANPGAGAGVRFTLPRARTLNNNQITNNAPGNNCAGESFTGSGNRYWPPSDTSCAAGTGTFAKAAQAITFTSTAPANAIVGSTYTVAAAGGASGNAVTFTVDASTASACSLSGSTVTFLAPGACRINANQLGNDDFDDAPRVQQIITIDGPTLAPTPVPTLGPWALIVMSAALAGLAGASVRRARMP